MSLFASQKASGHLVSLSNCVRTESVCVRMCVCVPWYWKPKHRVLCLIWIKWTGFPRLFLCESRFKLSKQVPSKTKRQKPRHDRTFNSLQIQCIFWNEKQRWSECFVFSLASPSLLCHSLRPTQDNLSLSFCLSVPQRCDQPLSVCYCCGRHMGPQWVVNLRARLCPPRIV